MTNDDVIALLRVRNRDRHGDAELDEIECRIRKGFELAGTRARHIASNGENSFDLVAHAARDAVAAAGLMPQDIDLVVYAGIARGWLEPTMAGAVQSAIGASNATCFDVLDACASWLRGVHVARSHILAGVCSNALVVNCESGMGDFVQLDLANLEALERHFASLTLGEAATATVIRGAEADDFYFVFRTFPEGRRLCRLPLSNVAMFDPDDPSPAEENGKFFARSAELLSRTVRHIVETFQAESALREADYDIYFAHAASEHATRAIARRVGLPYERCYPTHDAYGNTSAASVPLAMSLAHGEGRLRRGDRVLIGVGSAGITVGLASFTF